MPAFNPFAKTKNKKEETIVTVKLTKIQEYSEGVQTLENQVFEEFENQKTKFYGDLENVLNSVKEFVADTENNEKLMIQKINELKNEELALDKQQGEVAKALVDAEVAGDEGKVKKLDAQLAELGGKQVSLQAKIRAYTHRRKPWTNAKERKEIERLVKSYETTVFETKDFSLIAEDLNELINQATQFKEELERKIRIKPARTDLGSPLEAINRRMGIFDLVASDETKQFIAKEKQVHSQDISYFFESWLKCNKEIDFNDFVVEETERIKQRHQQIEAEAAQRKYEEQRARDERNARAIEVAEGNRTYLTSRY